MKRFLCLISLALVILLVPAFGGTGRACVGRILRMGVVDNPGSRVLSELYIVLIAERTGTTANPVFFKSEQLMYQAAAKGKLDFMIDNTEQAGPEAASLGMRLGPMPAAKKYMMIKKAFEQRLGLVWLTAFPVRAAGGIAMAAPVISQKALENFPILPRVLNMLVRFMNPPTLNRLVALQTRGANMHHEAEDFLKTRRLI